MHSSKPPDHAQPTDEARRVLLIDDDEMVRRTTVRLLELHGHLVRAVQSGEGAIAAVTAERFDVLLVDRSLPDMPGPTLLLRLRDLAPSSRIFYFTGYDLEGTETALVDGVIHKPVRTKELLALLAAARHQQ